MVRAAEEEYNQQSVSKSNTRQYDRIVPRAVHSLGGRSGERGSRHHALEFSLGENTISVVECMT